MESSEISYGDKVVQCSYVDIVSLTKEEIIEKNKDRIYIVYDVYEIKRGIGIDTKRYIVKDHSGKDLVLSNLSCIKI
jgi:hypothetical protein